MESLLCKLEKAGRCWLVVIDAGAEAGKGTFKRVKYDYRVQNWNIPDKAANPNEYLLTTPSF
jgi:hypothetical protein